jgi:hypothetical protein
VKSSPADQLQVFLYLATTSTSRSHSVHSRQIVALLSSTSQPVIFRKEPPSRSSGSTMMELKIGFQSLPVMGIATLVIIGSFFIVFSVIDLEPISRSNAAPLHRSASRTRSSAYSWPCLTCDQIAACAASAAVFATQARCYQTT